MAFPIKPPASPPTRPPTTAPVAPWEISPPAAAPPAAPVAAPGCSRTVSPNSAHPTTDPATSARHMTSVSTCRTTCLIGVSSLIWQRAPFTHCTTPPEQYPYHLYTLRLLPAPVGPSEAPHQK